MIPRILGPGDDVPARVGGYAIVERIGGGTTSSVFAAAAESGRQVAVKMMVADLEDDPETRERFFREADVTAGLVHRNIVRVLEVGEDEGRPYIVMELLHGLPLDVFLRTDAAQPIGVKLALMMQLCQGLHAAHDHGVVHRDVKPSNLFVERDGCLKILDLGLVRLQASTLTARGQIVGTPDFMSPEQAEGRQVDARSDVFSAAAVCYFILTGRAPFAASNLRSMLHALFHESPTPIAPGVAPEALERVLLKGLSKIPDERYQSCAEMLAGLEFVHAALAQPGVRKRIAAYTAMVGS